MILLQANQIARHFGAEVLFEHIHLEIKSQSRIALVGRNGAGKSTLLKIIAGVEAPDQGTIAKSKTARLGYLAQDTGLVSSRMVFEEMLTAFDEVRHMEQRLRELEQTISEQTDHETDTYQRQLNEYDRLQHDFAEKNGYGYESEIRSVLHGFGFDDSFYQKNIADLSGGQKTRLALAKMLLQKPDILILDEPTNHLDIATLSWLETFLPTYQGALLIVSHDRYFLDKVATEVYELSRHKLRHYKGNYSRYLELKAQELASEWKAYEKQQGEIHKLEDFVAKNLVRASTTKRAQSRRKALEKMTRLDRPQGDEKSANFLFTTARESGNVVLTVEQAAIGYEDQILAEPVSLDVRKRDAIALVGPNGIGKSTLLKSIIGQLPFIKGSAQFGANVDLGYYDQEQAHLAGNKTVLAELWDEHPTTPEKEIRSILGNFLFSGEDVEKTILLLSGGEKARVALAKLAMNQDNLLVLDEPTNHLDIDSKEVLENALIDYAGTLLFVSHDRYFINRLATKVIELSEDGSTLYLGDYDYYLEKKQEAEELAALRAAEQVQQTPQPLQTDNKQAFYQQKEAQKMIRSLQRKITTIESDLAQLEETIAQTEAAMTAPEALDDHQQLLELNQTLETHQSQQEHLLMAWEELSLELETLEN